LFVGAFRTGAECTTGAGAEGLRQGAAVGRHQRCSWSMIAALWCWPLICPLVYLFKDGELMPGEGRALDSENWIILNR